MWLPLTRPIQFSDEVLFYIRMAVCRVKSTLELTASGYRNSYFSDNTEVKTILTAEMIRGA